MGGVRPSPRVACSADFGREQEQSIEQVRRARDLLTVAADEQVEACALPCIACAASSKNNGP